MAGELPFHPRDLRRRGIVLLAVLGTALILLSAVLFRMQVFDYQRYQEKVLSQITVGAALTAPRGKILASGGETLAENRTVFRIWLSPVDIRAAEKEDGRDYAAVIAEGLSPILEMDAEKIRQKAKKTQTLDQTLLRGCEEETARKVLRFAAENGLSAMVHADAGSTRSYPFSTLFCHTIGFTGSDNQGLYGLEAYYDEALAGKDGRYERAIDSTGKEMPAEYASYLPAEPGYDLHTTLDVSLQRMLELQLEAAMEDADAQNRVCGVVMNVNTGAILAMATLPSFDCNDPYTLDAASQALLAAEFPDTADEGYVPRKAELLYRMWNNKPVCETYEPGSTFKIVTSAMALEEGAVTPATRFDCPGYYTVGGWRISCHKRTGHGSGITFAYGLQQSCNPVLMQTAERLGSSKFYRYFGSFGYLEKCGVDLPGEAAGIFHTEAGLGATELATASFGQRFKVNVIQHLCAVAAVANGGYLVTPHVADYMTDKDGNVVWRCDAGVRRQVISPATARTVSEILEEGVAGAGGAKNAYAPGYRVAAKTGTSEKFDVLDDAGRSYLRVGSCVAYAPYDRAEIAVIILVDEPTGPSVYGSVVAAPYVSAFLQAALPYLGYEPCYSEEEAAAFGTAGSYAGMETAKAKAAAAKDGFAVRVVGSGGTVLRQVPTPGTELNKPGAILLYTEESPGRGTATVPDLLGKSAEEGNAALAAAGLNAAYRGTRNCTAATGAKITGQSPPGGTEVSPGTVVTLTLTWFDDTD